YHRWSHAVAWRHTAERTQDLLGVAVGDGIYFSYLFLVLWIIDVVWLWLPTKNNISANRKPLGSPTDPAREDATAVPSHVLGPLRTPVWRVMVHVFLLFVAIN